MKHTNDTAQRPMPEAHEPATATATTPAATAPMPAVLPQAGPAEPPAPPILGEDGCFSPEWFTRFAELQPHAATLAKFRRPEALAKSYANLERLRGYPAAGDAARMAAFRAAVGLPEHAQDYTLPRPAETPDELWDATLAASMAQVAYEHGVPAPAMAALCEHYAAEGRRALQAAQLAQQQALDSAEAELRSDWGLSYEDNMRTVGSFLRNLGEASGVDVAALAESPALRANAEFARLMLAAASMLEEAPMHTGSAPNPRDEAHRIAHDPTHPLHEAYMRTSHPRHRYANEQYDRLAFGRPL